MLDQKNLFELAKITAKANAASPVAYSFGDNKFSYAELNETLRNELNEYAATPALYRENKNTIFSLMEVVVDEVLPVRVMEAYGQFAEIKQFGQGEKAVFTQRVTAASRRRAKQFITKVGLAGVYETFKLDGASFELKATAYGGAAEISIEELEDPEKFENVSDLYKQEQDEKRREGEAEFNKYMIRKRLWFFFPAEHLLHYAVGLLFAGIALAVGIALTRNKYNVKGNTVFFSVLSLIKIVGIIYFSPMIEETYFFTSTTV